MTPADLEKWLEELVERDVAMVEIWGAATPWADVGVATEYWADVGSALQALGPGSHLMAHYEKLSERFRYPAQQDAVAAVRGLARSALAQVRAGYLGSLEMAIRAQTEVEVLDRADELANGAHLVAATVLAGGALTS